MHDSVTVLLEPVRNGTRDRNSYIGLHTVEGSVVSSIHTITFLEFLRVTTQI